MLLACLYLLLRVKSPGIMRLVTKLHNKLDNALKLCATVIIFVVTL